MLGFSRFHLHRYWSWAWGRIYLSPKCLNYYTKRIFPTIYYSIHYLINKEIPIEKDKVLKGLISDSY